MSLREGMASGETKRASWDERFQELKAYKEKHGDCLVPQRYKPNPSLGRWVENQRSQYHRYIKARQAGKTTLGIMPEERILQLESIDFVWVVGRGMGKKKRDNLKPTLSWNQQLAEMNAKQEEHDNVSNETKMGNVASSSSSSNRGLEDAARMHYSESEYDQAVVPDGDEWNQRLHELKLYKDKHGNCLVPTKYDSNPQLGRWVSSQRMQYRRYTKATQAGNADLATKYMDQDRIAQLEEIGFVWVVRGGGDDKNANLRWQQRLDELKAYKEQNGDCLVPHKYPQNPQLGRWVMNQRAHYRLYVKAKKEGKTDPAAGGMNEDRIAQLDDAGFAWRTRPSADIDTWSYRLEELKAYKEQHGDCMVPRDYPPNQQLSNWVNNQRAHYRTFMAAKASGASDSAYSFMTEERIAQLDELHFPWTTSKRPPNQSQSEKSSTKKRKRVVHDKPDDELPLASHDSNKRVVDSKPEELSSFSRRRDLKEVVEL